MDLIGLKALGAERFLELLGMCERMDARSETAGARGVRAALGALQGAAVALLFYEPSTRTRVSFELAAARLGMHAVRVNPEESSSQKGESLVATCRNLEAMGFEALVIRHQSCEAPHEVAQRVQIPVINAGNGNEEHPTQALIDCVTLRRAFGQRGEEMAGKKVAIIGDIAHSRVARSDVWALGYLGCQVVLAGPAGLMPAGDELGPDAAWCAAHVQVAASRDEALEDADAVIMLRVQQERLEKASGQQYRPETYLRDWGIDEAHQRRAMKPGAFILHPGPVIHGMELSEAVADGARSLILQQVSHAVAVRQAVYRACLGAQEFPN